MFEKQRKIPLWLRQMGIHAGVAKWVNSWFQRTKTKVWVTFHIWENRFDCGSVRDLGAGSQDVFASRSADYSKFSTIVVTEKDGEAT